MMVADTSSSVNGRERAGSSSSKQGESVATPVILHSSLHRSSFTDYLGSGFKIRVSDSTPPDSAILPRCGIAVLIVQMPQMPGTAANKNSNTSSSIKDRSTTVHGSNKNNPNKLTKGGASGHETLDQLIARVSAFQRGHRVSVLVLVGAVFGEEEIGGVIGEIQKILLPHPPLILPAHGDAQAAAHLQLLAKTTVPERRRVVEERMEGILREAISRDHSLALGRAMGLNYHQVSVLLDSFGSLGNVAKATAEEIHRRTPFSAKTAASIVTFLSRDTVTV